ncbi:GDYXXLXY domain-containing protein [Lewinella sp. IMCC34183]|uniref:GDYXXLXY domain-containing protein n=1 Tax=Lewinella sp. IMCC34183 TaxID=2248762 RepID=UPI000E27EBF5|nr:GDYXXLXY domain-containing protein [Lewinella sp. IMCC34183]
MKTRNRLILLLATLAVLAYAVWFAYDKERILREGELTLFELAPVDPRSLLQGDYMALRYTIGRDLSREELPPRGYLVFTRDLQGVAEFQRIQTGRDPLGPGEGLIRFVRRRAGAVRNGTLRLGPESYFFEEGQGERYGRARYGGLRIDAAGQAVLVGLWDGDAQPIR